MKDLLVATTALLENVTFYLNPIGKSYLKYQLFFRVLFVGVLLSDIFGGDSLICDSNQPGCTAIGFGLGRFFLKKLMSHRFFRKLGESFFSKN